jgi:hypothetical protein
MSFRDGHINFFVYNTAYRRKNERSGHVNYCDRSDEYINKYSTFKFCLIFYKHVFLISLQYRIPIQSLCHHIFC